MYKQIFNDFLKKTCIDSVRLESYYSFELETKLKYFNLDLKVSGKKVYQVTVYTHIEDYEEKAYKNIVEGLLLNYCTTHLSRE